MIAWILYIIIIIVFFLHLCVQARQPVRRKKPNLPAPPSEALIDQCLPVELLDSILLQLDFQSYTQCRVVSKYWRSISTSVHLERILLDSETRKIRTRFEAMIAAKNLRTKLEFENFWTEYPLDDEATSERLVDLICAAKLNKYLLDIEQRALSDLLLLKNESAIDVQFQPYLITVRAFTEGAEKWRFCTRSNKGGYTFTFKPHKTLPWIHSQNYNGKAQIVMRLYEYLMLQRFSNMNLVFFRILEPLTWTFGIFPNDKEHLEYLAACFLVPQLMTTLARCPEIITGLLPFLVMTFNKIDASMDPAYESEDDTRQIFSRHRILIGWTLLGIIGAVLLYPYSLSIFAYIMLMKVLVESYFKCIKICLDKPTLQKWQKQLTAVIFAILFITSFDWSAVHSCFMNSDKLHAALFTNSVKHVIAVIYSVIDTCLLDLVRSERPNPSFAEILRQTIRKPNEFLRQSVLAFIALTLYRM